MGAQHTHTYTLCIYVDCYLVDRDRAMKWFFSLENIQYTIVLAATGSMQKACKYIKMNN